MRHEKSEKVRIIVAFGDIEGFTSFLDAITNDRVELDPYMDQFDSIVEGTAKRTGFHFRDTGDGFMCVVDLHNTENAAIAVQVALAMWDVFKRMDELRGSMEHPRWAGFRIVLASGYVARKVRRDGQVTLRGRHINLAHNMMGLARGHGVVCHESFRALIPEPLAKKHAICFDSLAWSRKIPDEKYGNVPRKDANSLFVMTVGDAKSVSDRQG